MSSDFTERVTRARKFVAHCDSVDGFRDRDLKTIFLALLAGVRDPDSNAHFDALVMLEDVSGMQIGE